MERGLARRKPEKIPHLGVDEKAFHKDERLTVTKYDWLRNPAVMDEERRRDFGQLRQNELKPARRHFQWWYNWAEPRRLEPMKEKAAMLKRRFANIITYFRHQITNAANESLNAGCQEARSPTRANDTRDGTI
jgi:transposase